MQRANDTKVVGLKALKSGKVRHGAQKSEAAIRRLRLTNAPMAEAAKETIYAHEKSLTN
jgi:hypothetical protein